MLRIRYSWRTLIVVTIVAGCVIGFFVRRHYQRRAAAEVHDAAKPGDVDRLRWCLWLDPELLDLPDAKGRTPLFYAIWRLRPEAVRVLLEAGADPNARHERGFPVIHVIVWTRAHSPDAGKKRRSEVLEALLDHGADIDARDTEGFTALHLAATAQWLATVELLLEAGADPNAVDEWGCTPLHALIDNLWSFSDAEAEQRAALPALAALLKAGADLNTHDLYYRTPLMVAMEKEMTRIVELLRSRGAKTYEELEREAE